MSDPIVLSVDVPLPVERAFALFTERMESWWPLHAFSIFGAESAGVVLEARPGGRIVETATDGRRDTWGEIAVWEPPHRLLLTWHPGTAERTEVEVTFEPHGDGTRVRLEHRGWEAFAERADEVRGRYLNGWPRVFGEQFRDAARAAA